MVCASHLLRAGRLEGAFPWSRAEYRAYRLFHQVKAGIKISSCRFEARGRRVCEVCCVWTAGAHSANVYTSALFDTVFLEKQRKSHIVLLQDMRDGPWQTRAITSAAK